MKSPILACFAGSFAVLALVSIEQGALHPHGCGLAGNDASDGKAKVSSVTR